MAFNEDDDITEMKSLDVDRVDAVGAPANGTGWLVLKAAAGGGGSSSFTASDIIGAAASKAKYSAEQLRALYKQGHAMKGPHGNIDYPIVDDEDLHNAIRAVGRGNADHGKIRSYIQGRAKALGHTDWIPDSWTGGTSKETEEGGWRMSKHAEKAIGVPSDAMPTVTAPAVAANPIGESDAAPAGAPPASETAALPTDGDSSTLGAQSTDPAALEGQTMENCTPVAGAPELPTQKAKKKGKKKRHMHNPQHPDTAGPAEEPEEPDAAKAAGDSEWEHTDVSLGQDALGKLRDAVALVQQFTHRENTEAADAAAVKEIHMTQDELVRLAEIIGAAADKKAAKAARKAEKKAAKEQAENAAKRIGELESRLETFESQPARNRPVLSGASGPVDGADAFKSIRDRMDQASERHDVAGVMRAAKQLSTAKLIAIENARQDGRLQHAAGLPDNAVPVLTGSHLLPADPHIRGI